jgi:hypothetical protein
MKELTAAYLRVGNLLNYQTSDGDVLPSAMDWQDLKWISQDQKGFNLAHSPIPITEEWLLRLGFEKTMSWTFAKELIGNNILVYYLGEKGFSIGFKNYSDFKCDQVHQVQNLYFALTGEELTLTDEK